MLAGRESNLIVVSKHILEKNVAREIKNQLMFCYVLIRQYHPPALPFICQLKTSFGELKKLCLSHFLFSTKSM